MFKIQLSVVGFLLLMNSSAHAHMGVGKGLYLELILLAALAVSFVIVLIGVFRSKKPIYKYALILMTIGMVVWYIAEQ